MKIKWEQPELFGVLDETETRMCKVRYIYRHAIILNGKSGN